MSATITLHPAGTPAAHAELATLARRIWREHYPGIISAAQIEYMLATGYSLEALAAAQRAGVRLVLARRADTALGLAAVSPQAGQARAWLDKLYIEAGARGQGLARRLLAWVIDCARDWGADELWLRVNRDNHGAIAAYKRLGFTIAASDRQPIGGGFVMDDYLMRRTLGSASAPQE